MVKEIPGYVYDASKNKYFKIQANHVAPVGSSYSREAVAQQRAMAKTKKLTQARERRSRRQEVGHSKLLNHPQNLINARLGLTRDTGKVVREYYGAALTPNDTWPTWSGGSFDIDNTDKTIVLARNTDLLSTPYLATGPEKVHRYLSGKVDLLTVTNIGMVVFVQYHANGSVHIVQMLKRTERTDMEAAGDMRLAPKTIWWNTERVWSLASSPSGEYWAAVDDIQLYLGHATQPGRVIYSLPPADEIRDQYISVAFKDEYTLMTANRGRLVLLHDRRAEIDHRVGRLKHDSHITHLHALQNPNQILVNGLTTMRIYDLRYTPAPLKPYHISPPSDPCMTFATTPRPCDRHGLGFAYDPDLDLVVRASSRGRQHHHVTLYSAASGRPVASKLNTAKFDESVSCIKFADVRDGPKTIVLSDRNKLQEWLVQGHDSSGDLQE